MHLVPQEHGWSCVSQAPSSSQLSSLCGPLDPLHLGCKEHSEEPRKPLEFFIDTRSKNELNACPQASTICDCLQPHFAPKQFNCLELCSRSPQNTRCCGPGTTALLTFVLALCPGKNKTWSSPAAALVLWQSLTCSGLYPVMVLRSCPAAGAKALGRHRHPMQGKVHPESCSAPSPAGAEGARACPSLLISIAFPLPPP